MRRHFIPAACLILLLAGLTAILIRPAAASTTSTSTEVDLSGYPWLYLRDGQPVADGEGSVSLITVGDVLLGRGVAGTADPLGDVAPLFHNADLVFGNLETAIAVDTPPLPLPLPGSPQPIILNSPEGSPQTLHEAGFGLLGLANNHTLDYGPDGLAETHARLDNAGLMSVGAGLDMDSAYRPQIITVRGVRLAFFAFNTILPQPPGDTGWVRADWDEARAVQSIKAANVDANAVIVLMHWGDEYSPLPNATQQRIAEVLASAGADLIVGSHPHVIQGTGVIGDSFVAYSMGNFAFDQDQPETTQGLALRALFDMNGMRGVQALPVAAIPRPRLLDQQVAEDLLPRIEPPSLRIGFACMAEGCSQVDVPQAEQAGLFWGGQIDLTGDGEPEIVRREASRVQVYQHGKKVFETPPEWRVVDAALGDPNDDGRYEIMLAIWKTDANGVEWSQPFIVGYRGGEYKLLWGGRAVYDPIQEIEVADIDGDHTDELIVLEQRHNGQQAISIWRWAGWSFGLVWRSPEGHFRDLALLTLSTQMPPLVSVVESP